VDEPAPQDLIDTFDGEFAEPNGLLLRDPEGEGGFAWPVPSWETEDAVDEILPDLSEGVRERLIDTLNKRSTIWVRNDEWNAMRN
jgi:hypothetical protein